MVNLRLRAVRARTTLEEQLDSSHELATLRGGLLDLRGGHGGDRAVGDEPDQREACSEGRVDGRDRC